MNKYQFWQIQIDVISSLIQCDLITIYGLVIMKMNIYLLSLSHITCSFQSNYMFPCDRNLLTFYRMHMQKIKPRKRQYFEYFFADVSLINIIINQNWFKELPGSEQSTNRYLNQQWSGLLLYISVIWFSSEMILKYIYTLSSFLGKYI